MECKDFQKLINDFIFDKIEYSEDLKEFLNHAKTCKNCGEELELYYTIRRGLGDVKAPDGSEESVDATQELENIINFYDEYFEKQRKRKNLLSVIPVLHLVPHLQRRLARAGRSLLRKSLQRIIRKPA